MIMTCPKCGNRFDGLARHDHGRPGKYFVCPECGADFDMKEFTVRPELTVTLSQEDIDDIMGTALDSITYWCCKAEVVGGEYLGEYSSDQISRGGSLILYDAESNDKWELTLDKFLNGVKLYLEHGGNGVLEADGDRIDTCEVDGEIADIIVQYALFGEVVFG